MVRLAFRCARILLPFNGSHKVVSSHHLHREHTKKAILCLNYGFFVFFAERHKKQHTLLTSIRFKTSSIGASSFGRSNGSARVDCIFSLFPMPSSRDCSFAGISCASRYILEFQFEEIMTSNLILVLNRC